MSVRLNHFRRLSNDAKNAASLDALCVQICVLLEGREPERLIKGAEEAKAAGIATYGAEIQLQTTVAEAISALSAFRERLNGLTPR